MGLTCACFSVYAPDLSSGVSLAQAAGSRLGYELIDNPEEAERQLATIVVPPWVSFFDLTNPPVITEEAVDLGKQLSAASGCPVLLTTVLDSDAFAFILYEKGKQVDAHASTSGLLPGRMKKWPPQKRAAEWSRLFQRPIGLDDVQALTQKEVLFAEELLLRLCDLVGLSGDLATRTPPDLEARPCPRQQRFYFRSRPGTPGGFQVKQTVANKNQTQSLFIGLSSIPFELNGPAGAFADPVLEFSGSAVDTGGVELAEGYGLWALGLEAIRAGDIRRVKAEVSVAEGDGQRLLRACLQGLATERFGFPPRKQSILIYWSTLHLLPGVAGEFQVSFLPNASSPERLGLRPRFLVGE